MMNTIKKYAAICTFLLMVLFAGQSCTDDFGDINRNPLLPDAEDLAKDGVLNGTFLPELQFQPIHTGIGGTDFVNDYQVTNNLTADSWMGYLAPRDAKWPGRNLSQFYFDQGWTNGTFNASITKVFSPWIQLKKLNYDIETPNMEIWAIAQITKIMGLHRSTDKYGAIPYFKVGSGSFTVSYDSQEEIYKSFFRELEEAVDVLYKFGISSGTIPRSSDVVYEGDALKWARLGNSLMLRLAMRVRYADANLSKQWAEKAMSHPAGLIETVDDIAKLEKGSGITTKSALYVIANAYNDTRMGASIQSYLKGYNDPRIDKYFEDGGKVAIRSGIGQTGSTYDGASKPVTGEFAPTYWFKASETSFLKAEAALVGYNTNGGTAKQFYEEGIRRSFAENTIASGVDNYIAGKTSPAIFIDSQNPKYSAVAPSATSVAWDEAKNDEERLEKIIIQKYLAIFPDGQEVWSEWRRTGYPRLIPPAGNISNSGVITSDGYKDGVRCWPYPQSELNNNTDNVNAAIAQFKSGSNGANINVWWDKKEKK